ncbi:MAG: hypothetical protein R3F43_18410 [bacterium]
MLALLDEADGQNAEPLLPLFFRATDLEGDGRDRKLDTFRKAASGASKTWCGTSARPRKVVHELASHPPVRLAGRRHGQPELPLQPRPQAPAQRRRALGGPLRRQPA